MVTGLRVRLRRPRAPPPLTSERRRGLHRDTIRLLTDETMKEVRGGSDDPIKTGPGQTWPYTRCGGPSFSCVATTCA